MTMDKTGIICAGKTESGIWNYHQTPATSSSPTCTCHSRFH